ncbi:MAG: hypothetical protein JWQ66_3935 [Mucilaginibacter sp.]|nr:hypothetical protein [Mucilaginibacter sp.]
MGGLFYFCGGNEIELVPDDVSLLENEDFC